MPENRDIVERLKEADPFRADDNCEALIREAATTIETLRAEVCAVRNAMNTNFLKWTDRSIDSETELRMYRAHRAIIADAIATTDKANALGARTALTTDGDGSKA